MSSRAIRLRRAPLQVIASATALLGLCALAAAPSQLDAPVGFDVPAQPLGEALRGLAKQANLQILFEATLVAGRSGREIRGERSARDALATLLRDTGLEAWEQAPGVVVIRMRGDARAPHVSDSIERARTPTEEPP